jgi:hypothetical protein
MLNNILKDIKCPICLEGELEYSQGKTFESYSEIFDLDSIEEIVDGVIDQYLVFECMECGATPRLRFKDIEFMARKNLTSRIMTMKAAGLLERGATKINRFYIYCGHCAGFDGRGSCPKAVYEKCEIKKVPNVL